MSLDLEHEIKLQIKAAVRFVTLSSQYIYICISLLS